MYPEIDLKQEDNIHFILFSQVQQPAIQQTTPQTAAQATPAATPILQSQNVSQQLKQLQQQQQQQQQGVESIKDSDMEEESMHLTIQPVSVTNKHLHIKPFSVSLEMIFLHIYVA